MYRLGMLLAAAMAISPVSTARAQGPGPDGLPPSHRHVTTLPVPISSARRLGNPPP